MKLLSRKSTCCPICNTHGEKLLDLNFIKRIWLPNHISLVLCAACDFAFTSPADAESYDKYYANTANDILSEDVPSTEELERYNSQISLVSPLLKSSRSKRVLDIGCGKGGLLRALRDKFNQHSYFGLDANLQLNSGKEEIMFYNSFDEVKGEFDLIIMSHVLEHIVDPVGFSFISKFLVSSGSLYVEVPDASRYASFPRKEYLYYIDRLHINHFTPSSLRLILHSWGFHILSSGENDFKYKDNEDYPACYAIANLGETERFKKNYQGLINFSIENYLDYEKIKAKEWICNLSSEPELLVYGFGDNFFRSVSKDGPLYGFKIKAIIDKKYEELGFSDYSGEYKFINLETASEKYSEMAIVVTVSWDVDELIKDIKEFGFYNIYTI